MLDQSPRRQQGAAFLTQRLPAGAFLTEQGTASQPAWLPRTSGQQPADYWKTAVEVAAAFKVAVAYRPGSGSNLGVRGGVAARPSLLAPQSSLLLIERGAVRMTC